MKRKLVKAVASGVRLTALIFCSFKNKSTNITQLLYSYCVDLYFSIAAKTYSILHDNILLAGFRILHL